MRSIRQKMDELMRKAIRQVEEAKRKMGSASSATTPWIPDHPHPQAYYAFDEGAGAWKPRHPGSSSSSSSDPAARIGSLALFSWNIDFMLPRATERMRTALAHLEGRVAPLLQQPPSATPETGATQQSDSAVVVFIQECVASDLEELAATPWIRRHFYLTDVAASAVPSAGGSEGEEGGTGGKGVGSWASGYYGTTALVDRRLPLRALFRVHYRQTRMDRDALFVDVGMWRGKGGDDDDTAAGAEKTIRLCNTHLESLALDPPFRPPQVAVFASYMRGGSSEAAAAALATPHGAVAAGDFNAIQDFDRTLHADNGLRDAFLELGGREDDPASYTWGQQAATELRERFGCSRMDKVYFCGGLKLRTFDRFGADVQLAGDDMQEEFGALGFEKPWVTDHLGIVAEFDVVD